MEKNLDHAYVRDDDVEGVQRVAFIRLVPVNTGFPDTTVTANEAHVDLDADGNIIGVTLFMEPSNG